MPPHRQKGLLEEIFSHLVVGHHTVGQRVEYAVVTLVKGFHSPFGSFSKSLDQGFIT